ncbi:hypothetical protein D3C80_1640010 [compost metagenome]
MLRRLDELLELSVGDRRFRDPEAVYLHGMGRSLFRIVVVRSHRERPAGDPDQAVLPTGVRRALECHCHSHLRN